MRRIFRVTLIASVAVAIIAQDRGGSAQAAPPVVPGAPNSFGMTTRAAYACGTTPTIYRVTNLANSGTGSLRAALQATTPRVVIFEISGYIDLSSDVTVNSPCLTVAGQTAPSPGITVRMVPGSSEAMFLINTHDVLMQHLRIRPGGTTCTSGIQVAGGNQANIVFDHMSLSWAQDENLAFNGTNGQPTNASVWRSIAAEGLYEAPGSAGCTGGGLGNGHGILMSAGSKTVFVGQTLFSTNFERNPYSQGDTQTVLVNNLVYQWHGPWGFFYANYDGGNNTSPWTSTAVGNRFIAGPDTASSPSDPGYLFVYSNAYGAPPGNTIYRSDNTLADLGANLYEEANLLPYDPNVGSPPPQTPLPSGYTLLPSASVETTVLANAGARPADRDAVDARIVQNVSNRTGDFISQPSDVGGYPILTVNTRALTLPANPHGDGGTGGYTTLEVWLHAYACTVEGSSSPSCPGSGPSVPTNLHILP